MILDPALRYFHSYHCVNSGVQRRLVEATVGPRSTSIFPPSFAMCTMPQGPTRFSLLRQPLWLLPSSPAGPRLYVIFLQYGTRKGQWPLPFLHKATGRAIPGLHNPPDKNLVNKILCKQLGGDMFIKSRASWENKTSLLWHVRWSEMRIFCLLCSNVTREKEDGRGEW